MLWDLLYNVCLYPFNEKFVYYCSLGFIFLFSIKGGDTTLVVFWWTSWIFNVFGVLLSEV